MLNESKVARVAPGLAEGAHSAKGGGHGAGAEVKRWSVGRKKEVVFQ